ncbi:PAS domain S-box protein, partial [Hymenobacter persicinus]
MPAPNPSSSPDLPFLVAALPGQISADACTLLHTMPWGVLGLAADGTVTVLNPAASALWGVEAAEVLGQLPGRVVPAVLPPQLVLDLAQAAPTPATYWLPHTQQWICMRTAPAGEGGRWVYWDNVTSGQQARHHRRKRRHTLDRLAALEQASSSGSYQVELDTMTFHLSAGMYRLFGETPATFKVTPAEVEARSHPDDVVSVREILAQAILRKQPFRYLRRIFRPDGQLRTLETHGSIICDAAGHPVQMLGLVQDITERQQAEATMLGVQQKLAQQATDQYRTLFRALDEGYLLAQVEFDEQHQTVDILYLDANPAATRMMGQDYTGKHLRDITPPSEPYWYELFGRVARTGVSERLELYAQTTDGWYDFYMFRIGDEGSARVAVVFRDVTERRQREAHAAFLTGIQDDFSRLATPDEIMQASSAKICAYLQLDTCCFLDIDQNQEYDLQVTYCWHSPSSPDLRGAYRSQDFLSAEFIRASRAGEPTIICDTQTDARALASAATYTQLGIRAMVGFPFHRGGEWQYLFSVSAAAPRHWQPDEVELLEEVARRLFPRLERARAEEALRRSEARYRSLFETMAEGFAVCELVRDAQGRAVDWRYIELNPAWERQTGLSREAAFQTTARHLLPDLEQWWYEAFEQVVDSGEASRFENYVETLGRWYQVVVFPQKENQRFAVLYDDITDRKQ